MGFEIWDIVILAMMIFYPIAFLINPYFGIGYTILLGTIPRLPFLKDFFTENLEFKPSDMPVLGEILGFLPDFISTGMDALLSVDFREISGFVIMLFPLLLPESITAGFTSIAWYILTIIGVDMMGIKAFFILIPGMIFSAQLNEMLDESTLSVMINEKPVIRLPRAAFFGLSSVLNMYKFFQVQVGIVGASWLAISMLHLIGPIGVLIAIALRTVMFLPAVILPYLKDIPIVSGLLCGTGGEWWTFMIKPFFSWLCNIGEVPFSGEFGFTFAMILFAYDIFLVVTCPSIIESLKSAVGAR